MSDRAELRFTIGQFLLFVAGFGVFLAVVMNRRLMVDLSPWLALACLAILTFMGGAAVVESVMGSTCPSCRSGRLVRVALTTFGHRFHRCDRCRARWKKGLVSGWSPVDQGERDELYARRDGLDPWSVPLDPAVEEDAIWSETHTNLLRNKQVRNPNAPRQRRADRVE